MRKHHVLAAIFLVATVMGSGFSRADFKSAPDIGFAGPKAGQDVVKLSFVMLNRDGTPQMERAAHFPFFTGELFRLKLLASQSGSLQISTVSPAGKATPLRPIRAQAGVEAFYPENPKGALEFFGATGNETLKVSFTPDAATPAPNPPSSPPMVQPVSSAVESNPPTNQPTDSAAAPTKPSDFFSEVQGKAYAYSKDIRETVIETPQATYLARPPNSGPLTFEIVIQHQDH